MIDRWLPIFTQSPNIKEHWGKTHQRRHNQQFWILYLFSLEKPPSLPCTVELTRTGPRTLDYDNMVFSLKAIRDAIAKHLTNDNVPGRADSDERITWVYKQKKGKLGVNIKIESVFIHQKSHP